MALTATQVAAAKGGQRTRYLGDKHGLRLRITPKGTKGWEQRITVRGKRRDIGLGSYDSVSLGEARDKAFRNWQEARAGGNPLRALVTFREAAEKKMALDAVVVSPKTHAGNERLLEQYAMPSLGDKRMNEVRTWHVMDILEPIWVTKHPTAKALLRLVSLVGRYSIAKGYAESDPADPSIIGAALPKIPRAAKAAKHHKAVKHSSVSDALAKVDASRAMAVSKALLRFTALTATRAGESRMADWSEIDLEAEGGPVWTVPADRMKARREHRVPLSKQAVALLEGMGDRDGLVFRNGRGKPLGEPTLRKLLRTLKLGTTLHGFRSSFRTWAAEARIDRDVAELCLAHVTGNGNQTERAYNRSDLLEARRTAMQAWADHVS